MQDSAARGAGGERRAGRLIRLVEAQRDAFRDLERLAADQAELIERDDAEGLLRVLSRRQGVVDQIASLGEELAPFAQRWDEVLAGAPAVERERLESVVRDLHEVARRVTEKDETDRAMLERRRNAMVDQLAGVARGRGAVNAYRQRESGGPRYQDREG